MSFRLPDWRLIALFFIMLYVCCSCRTARVERSVERRVSAVSSADSVSAVAESRRARLSDARRRYAEYIYDSVSVYNPTGVDSMKINSVEKENSAVLPNIYHYRRHTIERTDTILRTDTLLRTDTIYRTRTLHTRDTIIQTDTVYINPSPFSRTTAEPSPVYSPRTALGRLWEGLLSALRFLLFALVAVLSLAGLLALLRRFVR